MSNRHYPTSGKAVFESYEWLYREKLESLDHLTRQMWRDLRQAGVPSNKIPQNIQEFFAVLWEEVANEREEESKYRREKA